ncbi:protein FAR1-RELATED SEQUENCE 5-like [Camellia sinensis]|uniref:protein FAR1-RELATED SEQUENCE 5-like n=1 Tax=Camellia sinensis TaxID=4442 RepID=UPI00103641CB|nr:protein FAR1-RELATED SEQUENCE 5-like [Camellia sinensis]
MAKAIPIVMPNTNHRFCIWHLMQNAVKHVSSLFEDVGVKGVFSKFMHKIDDEEEFRIQLEQMLDRYDARNNHWLEQTFGVKEKWKWPYDYLNCDHNLMEFFMHFERVLYDKRYKELEAEYNLSQKLPRVSFPTLMLKQVAQIYTKTIFEEFQNEYVQSIKASIVGTINDGESTIFTIRTVVDEKKNKNVTMDRDGSLSCSCKKFEVKGILCQHCLKVLRDIFNATNLHAQYILKRWTKKARAEYVKDSRGYDVKVDVKLHQRDRYRSLINMFKAIASRAAKNEETYHLSLAKGEELSVIAEDKLSVHTCGQVEVTELRNSSTNTCPQSDEVDCPIQAKGLKKRQTTSKRRRRIKGEMEKSIAKKKRMVVLFLLLKVNLNLLPPWVVIQYRVLLFTLRKVNVDLLSPWGVYTPQGQSQPPFAIGSNYVEGNNTPQSMPPQSMPLVYPTQTSIQELLRGASVQQFAVQLSQASHSPADSHVDGHPWKACTKRREVGQVKFLVAQVQSQ